MSSTLELVKPEKYPTCHSRVFDKPLQFCKAPLAIGGSGQAYMAISETGEGYFVKMASFSLLLELLWNNREGS